MPVQPLPDKPDISWLRKRAKALLRSFPESSALFEEFHPRPPARPRLADAQLVTARMYGFASWPRLLAHLETLARYTRSPHAVPALDDLPGEFLRRACLTYGADDPARARSAEALLAAHPWLATADVFTMAATGSADALAAALAADPSLAGAQGGPFGWEPLLYLAYSRLPGRHLDCARLLLDHGADPSAGFLWDGLPSPFTALTGAFGRGEGDQPPHPQGMALARLLLERGADANDAQTLYNLGLGGSAGDDTAHLELLLAFGLGRGDGGVWKRRLGPALPPPAQLLRDELATAALRGWPRRTRLLLEHGAETDGIGGHPAFGGRRPYELALLNGHTEVAELLAAAGATGSLDPVEEFVAACMRGGPVDAPPELVARARARRPWLVNRAAEHGRPDAVRLLVALGWDVNHLRRATPLHEAAWRDDVETARTLVSLGADPSIKDVEHGATPLGWAEYGGRERVAAYLRTLE
ncbi:ankyrin repeat domain-containing protein [Thermoactinospora rubra]|uniref:ankyrin repeat domain-containing protein n=1 Tax=Thermoactinospora rubra TaxID=1088767 RepID=UPI000A0F62F2|nr:ankyrin repeat domain-containing protein [Thermoactinospora rubra]